MGLFHKKPDPLLSRSRALNAQIATIESQIKELSSNIQQARSQPKLRSTVLPDGPAPAPVSADPIFERVEVKKGAVPDGETTDAHYNDLGVRKYDLVAAWRRFQSHFRGPPANNPKLVSYLAAGSIKGLRPLRYEKRVARNRFLALFIFTVLVLWGIIASFLKIYHADHFGWTVAVLLVVVAISMVIYFWRTS